MPLIGLLIGVLGGPVIIAAYSAVFGARGGFGMEIEAETQAQTPPPDGEKRQEVDDVAG